MYDLDAIDRRPFRRAYPAGVEPSVTSHVPPPLADVTGRINVLQSELAACNRKLGTVRANYDRALVEAAHPANDVDEMRAELIPLRRQLTATQANLNRMMTFFDEYRQRYWLDALSVDFIFCFCFCFL